MKKKSTTIHIRLPSKLKKAAEEIAAANGLDLPSCIRMFLTHMNVRGALPLPPLTINGFTLEEEEEILRSMNEPTIPITDLSAFFKKLKEDVRD